MQEVDWLSSCNRCNIKIKHSNLILKNNYYKEIKSYIGEHVCLKCFNMKRIVVVSTNNNPDYYFYAPYQEKAWNKLGWTLCVMITNDVNPLDLNLKNPDSIVIHLPEIPELRSETIAQVGRLYVSNYLSDDDLIMTCDMDLIPLSDYWQPDPERITVYGHDLTWHSFYPMGYIAMNRMRWNKYMNLTGDTKEDIIRDAKEIELPYMNEWEQWWNHDWTLITKRLKSYAHLIDFKDRGQINILGATLAKGRIDRYNWKETQNQDTFIDAHCENNNVKHPSKLEPFLEVFNKFYP